jgi:hypothetical protein
LGETHAEIPGKNVRIYKPFFKWYFWVDFKQFLSTIYVI